MKNIFIGFFWRCCFPFMSWGKTVTKETLLADLIAWITGAIIVLPQWIAFATIAWLPPEYWLYTAMVTPIIAALFGSSMHLVSWPTTAISLVIFSTVSWFATAWSPEFISIALTLTFLAWIYQLVFWLAKLWKVVDFVSHTVVIGFTAWASILIVTSQMKSLLWLKIESSEFYEIWKEIFHKIWEINIYALAIWIFTLIIAILSKKFFPKIPNLLVALVSWSILTYFMQKWFDLKTDFVKFVPEIPASLPSLSAPDLSLIKNLAPSAFAIAILWLIEAVSISRSISTKSHQKINSNQEFIGQWLSNVIWSFFSSYAWSWSFTRSGVNYASWAKTPLSAIFAAIFLGLIVLLIAPITKFLPIPVMAWVILLVWYNLINFSQIKKIFKLSITETSILLVTFFSTLFLELEFAIYLWILLSLIIFLNKTSNPKIVTLLSNYNKEKWKRVLVGSCRIEWDKQDLLHCPQLEILRIDMSIYFGSVNYISEKISSIYNSWIKHILILGSSINFIDMTWVEMLEEQNHMLKSSWWWIYFVELKSEVFNKIKQYWLVDELWKDHFFETKKIAISTIYEKFLDSKICANCNRKVFTECWANNFDDYSRKPIIEEDNFIHVVHKIKEIFIHK